MPWHLIQKIGGANLVKNVLNRIAMHDLTVISQQSRFIRRLMPFLLLLAGGLAILAFAPYRLSILIVIAMMILLNSWLCAQSKRQAGLYGALFGFAYFGFGVYWVSISLSYFIGIWPAWLATLLLIIVLALFPALVGYVLGSIPIKRRLTLSWFLFPILWVSTECLRSCLFGGFPWLLLGYTQTDTWLAKFATLGSVYMVSFILCLISVNFLVLWYGRRKQRWLSLAVLLIIAAVTGALHVVAWPLHTKKTLSVSIIQANIELKRKWHIDALEGILAHYRTRTEKNWSSDIIVWPETAIPVPAYRLLTYLTSLNREATKHRTSLLIGIPTVQEDTQRYYNSLLLLGKEHSIYHKRHLVPFGEYVPFKPVLRWLAKYWTIPMSDLAAGSGNQALLPISNHLFVAPFICYEIAYPYEVTQSMLGANLIIVITDDVWFGHSAASAQHLQIAQMRALENGRYVLFASNAGDSAIIDESGYIRMRAELDKAYVLSGKLTAYDGDTPWVSLVRKFTKLTVGRSLPIED